MASKFGVEAIARARAIANMGAIAVAIYATNIAIASADTIAIAKAAITTAIVDAIAFYLFPKQIWQHE